MTTVSLYVTDELLPCSAVRKVSCSSVIGARLSAARISVSSGILRAKQLEHWSTRVAAFSARLLYPCCQVHRGSHWRQNSNDQRGRQGGKKKKKKTFSVWSTAGDISTAATASTPSHSFRSSTRRLVSGKMLLLLLCDAGSRHWADGVTEFQQVLCVKTPPRQRYVFRRVSLSVTCQHVFAQLMPSYRQDFVGL